MYSVSITSIIYLKEVFHLKYLFSRISAFCLVTFNLSLMVQCAHVY